MTPDEKAIAQRSQTYHHHELRRMRRAAEAKQLGLDVHEFAMPWPGNQSTVHHHNNGNGGWIKGALLSAAFLGIGAGGGTWLASMLHRPRPNVSQPSRVERQPVEVREKTRIWDYEFDLQVLPPNDAVRP